MSFQEVLKYKSLITVALNPTPYDLGNEVLYNLCTRYPKHINNQEIIAKV